MVEKKKKQTKIPPLIEDTFFREAGDNHVIIT